jgi:uncharacterized protein YdhG (YjbR/CyaY superfamily)
VSVIDDYLKNVGSSKRKELERIRALAKAIVPAAEEAISYGMPTLKLQGKPFLGFDAHEDHIGVYPFSGHIIEMLEDELRGYRFSKGALRVPLDRPISKALLKKIIDRRIAAIRAQSATKTRPARRSSATK